MKPNFSNLEHWASTKSNSTCPSLCGGRKMGLSKVRSRRIGSPANFASSKSSMDKANRSLLALSIARTLRWFCSCRLAPRMNLDLASMSRCSGPSSLPPLRCKWQGCWRVGCIKGHECRDDMAGCNTDCCVCRLEEGVWGIDHVLELGLIVEACVG